MTTKAVVEALHRAVSSEQPVALATIVELTEDEGDDLELGATLLVRRDSEPMGSLGDPQLDATVCRDAIGHMDAATTGVRHYGRHGEARRQSIAVFIQTFAPPPRLIIFGAVDFSAALAGVAKTLGFRVTVCDPRPVFATAERFPMADEIVVDWPDRYLAKVGSTLGTQDAICVLTHDQKFDVPAIMGALRTEVGYIGAMGSRRTTRERDARLKAAGVDEVQLQRVMAPIGIDIGARTPAETAVSICAEIVAMRSGAGTGSSLRAGHGPVHRRAAP